jgi:hypothetical protein
MLFTDYSDNEDLSQARDREETSQRILWEADLSWQFGEFAGMERAKETSLS